MTLRKKMLLILTLGLSAFLSISVQAAIPSSWEGKAITAIEFQGLKRIEKDAVISKIQSKVGQPFLASQIKTDIQNLFGMGFFEEIDAEGDLTEGGGLQLRYRVKERPVIARIEFDGNEQISDSDLKEKIKVKEWSILDLNKIQADVEILQKFYEEKGFYLAKIKFEVKPIQEEGKEGQEDQVELIYRISDFDKIQIKKITFLNNKVFSDEQLKGILGETREGGFFSFLSSSGNFKESTFKQDLQRLHYWYLDHGYVKFRHENPVVTISDDKRWIYISIYVEEGDRYQMGTTDYSGDLLFTKDELNQDRQLLDGEYFSLSKRNADIQRLTEKYQDLGYAFVNVIPKMEIKDETKRVDLEYQFEKGHLVHFGEIYVIGNSKTHDKVIRRELRIKEGELYSGSKLRISRENVERLGYFAPGEVIFNTKTPPGGQKDILDVEIQIKERSTGTVTLGAGYGTLNGFFLQSQISEINLFGRGQSVSLAGTYTLGGQIDNLRRIMSRSFSINFTDPYAFDTRFIMGGDLFWTVGGLLNKYTTRKLGFNARVGHPIVDYTNAYLTYKNEYTGIIISEPHVDQADIDADTGILSSVVFNVIRDKRNNRFETSGGNFQNVSLEVAGLGGEKHFVKAIANNRFYFRLVGDLVFRNNIELGTIFRVDPYPVPPSERFYLGGPMNMRGFYNMGVGPSARKTNRQGIPISEPLGGLSQVLSMVELEYPVLKDIGLKAVTFFDAGNVYRTTFPDVDQFSLRTNLGMGVRWFSPLGPLRFEWGFPLNRKPGEDASVFQFWIGPPF